MTKRVPVPGFIPAWSWPPRSSQGSLATVAITRSDSSAWPCQRAQRAWSPYRARRASAPVQCPQCAAAGCGFFIGGSFPPCRQAIVEDCENGNDVGNRVDGDSAEGATAKASGRRGRCGLRGHSRRPCLGRSFASAVKGAAVSVGRERHHRSGGRGGTSGQPRPDHPTRNGESEFCRVNWHSPARWRPAPPDPVPASGSAVMTCRCRLTG